MGHIINTNRDAATIINGHVMDLMAESSLAYSLGILDASSVAIMKGSRVFVDGFIVVIKGTDVDGAYEGLIDACLEGSSVAYNDGEEVDT